MTGRTRTTNNGLPAERKRAGWRERPVMPVVVAVDRSGTGPQVVEEARRIADRFDQELHVVHVLSRSEFVDLERTSVEDTGRTIEPDRLRETAREIAEEIAESVTADFEAVGLIGDVGEEVVDYADRRGAEYVVVGGRKRSPVGKALFGSVTQDVLLHAPMPVVTVKVGS